MNKTLTNQQMLSEILRMEKEMTMAVIKDGHQPYTGDKFEEYRHKLKIYRDILGIK